MLRVLPLIAWLCAVSAAWSQANFQGDWRLNADLSDIQGTAPTGSKILHIEQNRNLLVCSGYDAPGGSSTVSRYPLDGSSGRFERGPLHISIKTKWEGDVLLASVLFSGGKSYAVDERWTRSGDGRTLTINRTLMQSGVETESILVYESPSLIRPPAPRSSPVPARETLTVTELVVPAPSESSSPRLAESIDPAPKPAERKEPEYVLNQGTRILMQLTNAIDTKHTVVGDKVYLETAVPVFANRRLVIPAHSYVMGTVIEAARAGRVKGKSALNIRFDSLTLANGTTRNLASRPGSVDGGGDLDRTEGRITGEGGKGKDAQTVAKTTAAGTSIGAIAGAATGHLGMGAGIGAAAGALGGMAGVLGSRGPDVVLRPGTTMEFILDRELRFTETELLERVH